MKKVFLLLLATVLFIVNSFAVTIQKKEIEITSSLPGSIDLLLTKEEMETVTELTVKGIINARDFRIIRDKIKYLSVLDLTKATIASYSGKEGTYSNSDLIYKANSIPRRALKDKSYLNSVKIPNTIKIIEDEAFSSCTQLKRFEIPNSVDSIGQNAFSYCNILDSLTIPQNVQYIGKNAFYYCGGLKVVFSLMTNPAVTTGSIYSYINSKPILYVPVGSKEKYENNTYWNSSFKEIIEQTEINKTKSVYIESSGSLSSTLTPNERENVIELIISGNIDKRDFIFLTCKMPNLTTINIKAAKIKAYQYHSENEIPRETFDMTQSEAYEPKIIKLKKIILPANITKIGEREFYNCEYLETVELPQSLTGIGDNAFWTCTSLENINIPTSLTYIGVGAFGGCFNLKSITIPEGITTIKEKTFYGDTNLISVVLPSKLAVIENNSFTSCSNLSSISIPETITRIGCAAFNSCTNLKNIYIYKKTPFELGNGCHIHPFNINKDQCTLYVPKGNLNLYKTTAGWADFKNIVEMGNEINVENIDLNKSSLSLIINQTETLSVIFTPENATNRNVTWKSDDTNIATVSASGEVKAVSAGKTTITVTSEDGNKTANCEITVTNTNEVSDFVIDENGVMTGYNGPGGAVVIPNTVKEIAGGLNLAGGLSGKEITSVYIPASVEKIYAEFCMFEPVEGYTVDPANQHFSSENGILYNKNKTILIKYPCLSNNTSYAIPNMVNSISIYAFFNGAQNLEYLTIPCEIENIGVTDLFNPSRPSALKYIEITGTSKLSSVIFCMTPQAGQNQISIRNQTLIVPVGMKAAYQALDNCNCAQRIIEKGEESTETGNKKRIKRIETAGKTNEDFFEFFYDEKGRLSSCKETYSLADNNWEESRFTYNSSGQLTKTDIYDSEDNGIGYAYNFTYRLDSVFVHSTYKGEPDGYVDTLVIATDGRLLKENGAIFEYDASGNMIKKTYKGKPEVYDYDNYQSVFSNQGFPRWFWQYNANENFDHYANPNNVVKISYSNVESDTYSYTYDEDGYPTAMFSDHEKVYTYLYENSNNNNNDEIILSMREVALIEKHSARAYGYINTAGKDVVCYFNYGISGDNLDRTTEYTEMNTNERWLYFKDISGLEKNTVYYCRFVASVDGKNYYSETITFKTLNDGYNEPTFKTLSAAYIAISGAHLNGNISPNENDITYWFEYGTSSSGLNNETTPTLWTGKKTGTSRVASELYGLSPNTTYYFRLVIKYNDIIKKGEIESFATLQGEHSDPVYTLEDATHIGSASARLNAVIQTNGNRIGYVFEYGKNKEHIDKQTELGTLYDDGIHPVNFIITDLEPETTYYYYLKASVLGSDVDSKTPVKSFRTSKSNENITITPSVPVNNKGAIDLSLNIPSDKSLTGGFTVTMPEGLQLDKENTALAQALQNNHSLDISGSENRVWTFNISPKVNARSGSNATYQKIVEIVYTIDENVASGNYNIEISKLEFVMDDNSTIKEANIKVNVTYTSSVGNTCWDNTIKVSYCGNILIINTPIQEYVSVYSINGMLLFNREKPEGEAKYQINGISKGVIIIKGSSGWVEKLMVK